MMELVLPYAVMFAGGALTSIFDIHAKQSYLVIGRHKLACALFAAIMGVIGIFFFWSVQLLNLLNPNIPPLVASLLLFLGYRVLIQSNIMVFQMGGTTRQIGFAWIYEEIMFLFFDYIKSREALALREQFLCLPLSDLVALARNHADTAEDTRRVEGIAALQHEEFKKKWLATFCAEAEERLGQQRS